jgi:predicted MPP superfamily phosphohydrolase
MTRRGFLKFLGGSFLASTALAGYAFAIEPLYRLTLTRYALTPPNWTAGLRLRIAIIADLHACNPWMGLERIHDIVDQTNALEPDLILMLGDYTRADDAFLVSSAVPSTEWATALARLDAPLGRYAVLGNHDWWEDMTAQKLGHGPTETHRAFAAAGVRVLENDAIRLTKAGKPFWLAGLGDQIALRPRRAVGRSQWTGVDDLPGTMAKIEDDAPIVLMAHEPDIFPAVPDRVSLTLSGHTHGGQVRLFGYSPLVPSRYGNLYAYGHVIEDDRHLIVSGGLGCSIAPVRFGVPPEIVMLDLGSEE